ncbi:MAG: AMP-binding protein [Halioglobus sp.]|nr:AMP-binding protein [Halioglobus sp.]
MNKLPELLFPSHRFNQDRIALLDPAGTSVTYSRLWERVDRLGRQLREAGSTHGTTVGILAPKNDGCVVSICAVLATGAAYVPVDPYMPATRACSIFADCQTRLLIVGDDLVQDLVSHLACGLETLPCSEPGLSILKCSLDTTKEPTYTEDLAVILYTSGSTGTPKGVQLTHTNALAFIFWCVNTFDLSDCDVCASTAPFQFDLSLFDLFVSLYRGATILLLEHRTCQNPLLVAASLSEHKVSVCYATPTMLKMLLRHGRLPRLDFSALKLVLFAGEEFPIVPLRELKSLWHQARFYNLYGPTESNVVTFQAIPDEIDPLQQQPFPIGRPCEHVQCLLATASGCTQLVPGTEGELLVWGPSVTPGYYADREKNLAAFLLADDGRHYYRTGDFVRGEESGALQVLGRRDRTVKRRGDRIALEELERVLGLHPAACEVAVKSSMLGPETTIDAYFVARSDCIVPAKSALKLHCQEFLPAYFLPDRFIVLESLPKTSTGKIDYRNLECSQ